MQGLSAKRSDRNSCKDSGLLQQGRFTGSHGACQRGLTENFQSPPSTLCLVPRTRSDPSAKAGGVRYALPVCFRGMLGSAGGLSGAPALEASAFIKAQGLSDSRSAVQQPVCLIPHHSFLSSRALSAASCLERPPAAGQLGWKLLLLGLAALYIQAQRKDASSTLAQAISDQLWTRLQAMTLLCGA